MPQSINIANRVIFIVIPNNNGSTFVYDNLSNCANTVPMRSGLFKEGEKIVGMRFNSGNTPMPVPFLYEPRWAGPDIPDPHPGLGRIWGAERTALFQDEKRFDWDRIKKIWIQNWMSNPKYDDNAILLEKSPTSPAWAFMFPKHFPGARYIISIRNPYSTVEGIRRRVMQNQNTRLDIDICTQHWIKTAELQIQNINTLPRNVWFTYEELCEKPGMVADKIRALIPELRSFQFVNLKPMNQKSISSLTHQEIEQINQCLKKYKNLMEFFSYEILE